MQRDATLTIRLPSELKETLARVAEADHRSLGQLITKVMTEYLEGIGEWPPGGSGRRRRRAAK